MRHVTKQSQCKRVSLPSNGRRRLSWSTVLAGGALLSATINASAQETKVMQALERVRSHDFHPLSEDQSFTLDRALGKHGVADLRDADGRVRLLEIRDLVVARHEAVPEIVKGLRDPNQHVRQVCAAALGILSAQDAGDALGQILQEDPSALVRTQAAISLGEIASRGSLPLLRTRMRDDPSRDVRLQCELAIDRIGKGMGATDELREAYRQVDVRRFALANLPPTSPCLTRKGKRGHLRISRTRTGWC